MEADHLFTEMCDNGSTDAARVEDLGPGDFVKVDLCELIGDGAASMMFMSRFGCALSCPLSLPIRSWLSINISRTFIALSVLMYLGVNVLLRLCSIKSANLEVSLSNTQA